MKNHMFMQKNVFDLSVGYRHAAIDDLIVEYIRDFVVLVDAEKWWFERLDTKFGHTLRLTIYTSSRKDPPRYRAGVRE